MKTPRSLAILILSAACVPAQGGGILTADTADAGASFASDTELYQSIQHGNLAVNAGRHGTAGVFHTAVVIPFQLPDLGTWAAPFASASFTFRLATKQNTGSNFNVDLYGLAPRSSAAVLPDLPSATEVGDFFMAGFRGLPGDDPTPGVVKLQDGIVTNAIASGATITTDEAGSTALANYLNAAYNGGAGAGSWVFLRLSMDGTPGGVNRYSISTADETNEARRPFITYELADPPETFPLTITPAIAPAAGFVLEWESQAGKLYNLRTSTDLAGPVADWELVQGDIVATPPTNLESIDPTDPRRFYAVEQFDAPPPPPLFSEGFEAGNGGFTLVGAPNDWAWGTPNSDNGAGLVLTAGNGGSANCWGTNLGTGGTPSGLIDPAADSILRSPDIDLTGVTGAKLSFAAAYDAQSGDVIEVLVRAAATDTLLATISPVTAPLPGDSDWVTLGPFDLSAADNTTIYLEFRYDGTSGQFIGLYIDDVTISR